MAAFSRRIKDNVCSVLTEVAVGNRILKLWSFEQLEFLSTGKLRQKAMDIRDMLKGIQEVPRIPVNHESLVQWILDVQTDLSGHSHHEFGVPKTVYERARDRSPYRFLPEQSHPHLYYEDQAPEMIDGIKQVYLDRPGADDGEEPEKYYDDEDEEFSHGKRHFERNERFSTATDCMEFRPRPETENKIRSERLQESAKDHLHNYADVWDEEPTSGKSHKHMNDDYVKDHMESLGVAADQDTVTEGRRHIDADWVDSHMIAEGTAAAQAESVHGRQHPSEDLRRLSYLKDHFDSGIAVQASQHPVGRKHMSESKHQRVDHIEPGMITEGDYVPPKGRNHALNSAPYACDHMTSDLQEKGDNRPGSGRRHFAPQDHMVNEGTGQAPVNPRGQGRVHNNVVDHLRNDDTTMPVHSGRKHAYQPDHFVSSGAAEVPDARYGRHHFKVTDHLAPNQMPYEDASEAHHEGIKVVPKDAQDDHLNEIPLYGDMEAAQKHHKGKKLLTDLRPEDHMIGVGCANDSGHRKGMRHFNHF